MLKAEVLGQLLLMQSIIINLPDKKSIMAFVKKGLLDIPGVKKVYYCEGHCKTKKIQQQIFPLNGINNFYGELILDIDKEVYKPYHDYLKNFIVLIELTLEERHQRSLNEEHQRYLENEVQKRKDELNHEIRQRQLIETNLKKSEQLFSYSFENKTIGVCLVSTDGRFLKVNNVYSKILGYSERELLKKKFIEITHPDDVEKSKEYVKKLLNGELEFADLDKRYIGKKGKIIYAHVSLALVRNIKNEPEHFIVYINDITNEMIINEALKTSEYNYKQLFENMTSGFAFHKMIYDENGKPDDYIFLTMNKSFEKLTGLKAKNIIGKTARESLPGLEEYWIENYGKVALTGKPIVFENYSCALDKYYEVKAFSPKRDHFAVMFSDITKNKKAEIAINASEEKFRTFFENINEASALHKIITDENKNPVDFEFIEINPAYEKITSFKAKDVIGKRGLEVIPNLEKRWIEIYGEVALTGKSVSFIDHSEYLNKYWNVKAFSTRKGYFAVAFSDVTEMVLARKELEINEKLLKKQNQEYEALNEELKQTNEELYKAKERAEESDRLKSAFLANMSHEIRTPMNGLIGFANLINAPNISADKRKHFTEVIQNSCNRLLNIVNDIIDISKIETGQVIINIEKTNINDIILELFSFYKPVSHKNNVNLYTGKTLKEAKAIIETDKVKFTQILNNLLNNAIKFTHEGYIKFGYTLKDNMLEFYVKDSGIGISPDQQNIIFDRFQQARQKDMFNNSGTGLGLAIAKAYIEILGGKIWVKSEPGKGSAFYFTLPYNKSKNSEKSEGLKNTNLKPKLTVLIIEDEEINFLLLEEILLELDIKILHARNGKETLQIVKDHKEIELILMDIKLPDTNGYILTKKVKKILPSVPVIAQTAYAMEGDREKALSAGCVDYISKPIVQKELIEIIDKQTNHK